MDICQTGLWVDTQAGTVVDSPPEEGHLLAAPGTVITANRIQAIERHAAAHGVEFTYATEPAVEPETEAVDTATEPEPETAEVTPKRAPRKGTTR